MTLTATFRRPFNEQVAAFRLRLGDLVPTATWEDMWQAEHDRAFMVAGATKADLLADLAAAVDRAIAGGGTLETFRRDFRELVERNGWHNYTGSDTKGGRAWRTKVIYRTNAKVSYHAGRFAQLQSFPFWIYRHGGSADPREQHLALDRIVVEREHPFWAEFYPPNGWGCSCYVTGARSREAAAARGGDLSKELPEWWTSIDPKTGAPVGIDRGWAYAPGAAVAETINQMARKPIDWRYALGVAFMTSLPDEMRDRLIQSYRALPSTAQKVEGYAKRAVAIEGNSAQADQRLAEPQITLGLLTTDQARRLGEALGVSLDKYDLALSADAIRHAWGRHSNAKIEASRGQVALELADFSGLLKLMAVVDRVLWGDDDTRLRRFWVSGVVNDRRLEVLLEIGSKHRKLNVITMFVKHAG